MQGSLAAAPCKAATILPTRALQTSPRQRTSNGYHAPRHASSGLHCYLSMPPSQLTRQGNGSFWRISALKQSSRRSSKNRARVLHVKAVDPTKGEQSAQSETDPVLSKLLQGNSAIVQMVNVHNAEVLYNCRHNVAPALDESGMEVPSHVRRMISTTIGWDSMDKVTNEEEYKLEPLEDGTVSIMNVLDEEYLTSFEHNQQACLDGDPETKISYRMVATQQETDSELPKSARWSLRPVPGGTDQYNVINVATGESLYACRHSAVSWENGYERRMVSTLVPQEGSDLQGTDVWYLVETSDFSIEEYRRETNRDSPNFLAGSLRGLNAYIPDDAVINKLTEEQQQEWRLRDVEVTKRLLADPNYRGPAYYANGGRSGRYDQLFELFGTLLLTGLAIIGIIGYLVFKWLFSGQS